MLLSHYVVPDNILEGIPVQRLEVSHSLCLRVLDNPLDKPFIGFIYAS